MANYYTQFSCELDLKATTNISRAKEIYSDLVNSADPTPNYGSLNVRFEDDNTCVWIYSDESGDINAVVGFVNHCAKEFSLTGLWGFQYANTCSKPRLDDFGGGAVLIDLATQAVVSSIDTSKWLEDNLTQDRQDVNEQLTVKNA